MYTHTMEDIFQKEIERSEKLSALWKNLQNGDVGVEGISSTDKEFYVQKLEQLMSIEQEKWRDKEGKEFYERVTSFIDKLSL